MRAAVPPDKDVTKISAKLGMVLLDESRNPARLFFLGLLLVSIVGLKFTGE